MDDLTSAGEAVVDSVKKAAAGAASAVAGTVAGALDARPAALPADRSSLLALHREARRRRDEAPLESHARAEAAMELERIEVQIARVERAMDPPRV